MRLDLSLDLKSDNVIKKLWCVAKGLIINIIIASLILLGAILAVGKDKINNIISTQKKDNISFFIPPQRPIYLKDRAGNEYTMNNFKYLIIANVITPAIQEEALYRGPIYIALTSLSLFAGSRNILPALLIIPAIKLNLAWASIHQPPPIQIPVFFTGITFFWLVYKTKSLWPSILCHALANILIYFTIQTAIFFSVITPVA